MQAIQREAIAPTRDPLTYADRQIIASILTWDMQQEISPEEVETIAIVHDIVWVKLTDNRAIPLHVETFRAIRHQQLEQQTIEEVERVWGGIIPSLESSGNFQSFLPPQISREFVTQLEARLEAESRPVFTTGVPPVGGELFKTADEIEIDSTKAGIYRVWKGMNLIGTVRRCKYTMCWLAFSALYLKCEPYLTSELAIAALRAAWEAA